jgi:hypothetical protein
VARAGLIPRLTTPGMVASVDLPFVEMVMPKLRIVYLRFLHAFDAFAEDSNLAP